MRHILRQQQSIAIDLSTSAMKISFCLSLGLLGFLSIPTEQSQPNREVAQVETIRACNGTNNGFSISTRDRYREYRMRYGNCTHVVDGNLELVILEDPTRDLSFLSSIREVSGYVLIVSVFNDYVPLTSLRVIRGRTLFEHNNIQYGLFMALNYKPRSTAPVGLKELRFTSLNEISRGGVYIGLNQQLCFEETIKWKDIVSVNETNVNIADGLTEGRKCKRCDLSCEDKNGEGHCWGEGPNMCQSFD